MGCTQLSIHSMGLSLCDFSCFWKPCSFDTWRDSEAAAVRVLAYFFGGDTTNVHYEKFSIVELEYSGESPYGLAYVIWPHVIKLRLRRFPSDEVLRETHYAIVLATSRTRFLKRTSPRGSRGRLSSTGKFLSKKKSSTSTYRVFVRPSVRSSINR